MVKEITFYYHPMCSGCMEIKPIIKEIAGMKGWAYHEVNVVGCKTKICNEIEYVPTIFVDGREIELEDVNKLLSK